ncbi:hypothetical protein ABH920_005057 [Catenulispora sp. EB89]|uniref:NF041680 family putative transposase n=1 Tax=Catenulispora sp. EB89 TaxID=3156257 RepID=UPI0035167A51
MIFKEEVATLLEVAMAAVVSQPQRDGSCQGELRRFRGEAFDSFTRWSDALWELVDGLCQPVAVDGIAHLSLAALAMRGHGSGYAALARGAIDDRQLRDVLAGHRPATWRPDFAVDCSTWARCDAECSPGRGFYHHPSRHSAGQPIVAGWCFSWLAGLSQDPDSWTAPLDVVRVQVGDNANTVAVAQIKALLPRLDRLEPSTPAPLFAFDGGYDPVQLTVGLAGSGAQVLVRVKSNRVFFGRPGPGTGRGRPRRHGDRFALADPATWHAPDAEHAVLDPVYGSVQVTAWRGMHPKQDTYRDPGEAMTIVEGTVVRVQVGRLPGRRDREPKTLWLWHAADDDDLDLDRWWRTYLRRFDIEHTLRFAKQSLGWTTPKLRTPEQADRWTWLVVLALTQLRLARPLVADHRLPWQRPQTTARMTPGRVRQGFGHLLHRTGTPASYPKPSRPGPARDALKAAAQHQPRNTPP